MAELVLSTILPVLFEKLASATVKSIARYKGIDAEIKKWERSFKQIQRVLADASHKEITDDAVKEWLNDLQHLAYDIDDVLDGWATDAMHPEFTHDSKPIASMVRKLIPSCCANFSRSSTVLNELDSINVRLEDLLKEKANLGLSVEGETRPKNTNRKFQSSVVDPSRIVGRQVEKEALVHQLLMLQADEPSDQNYGIVAIFGMGGVGKTTLARLLYDESQVKDHFEIKAWVCVSDKFDSFAISKTIFKAVADEVNKEFTDFNLVQEALRDRLRGKRFLLVLDDIWTESHEDWNTLVTPFYTCAPGSKIIITTRKKQLLQKLGYDPLNKQLRSLSNDDALSLFALHALGVKKFDSHMSLKPHGEAIVKKCGALPLALITLGTSLRTKEDEDSWKRLLESEIWNLPVQGEIIPALRLSYHDLSAPLKQLFAYCSLFPKDFLFDKEELVLLWRAEGFLHQPPPSSSTEVRLGHEYFDELLSRSLFQHAPNNESLFVMHDLMNDLATYVATEFFIRLDNESEKNIRKEMLEKYRHMSFVREEYVAYKKFEAFKRAKSLRTFLATYVGEGWRSFHLSNKILTNLLPDLPMLRVLCLSHFNISEVPDSIGTLKHLRYLNLTRTAITHLPESVCNLYNLETLKLIGCGRLAKLPNNFGKLKNLQHLDITYCESLDQMPLGIGELKGLQTLTKIVIGGENGFEIAKLKEFKNLGGKLFIVGLDKVENATHAREANFLHKKFSDLELEWSDELHGSRNEMLEKEVLNELKPCNESLIELHLRSYGGLEFPDWVGDPSFLHLKHVSLSYCKRCTTIPPLGQLPSLEELFIAGLDGVEVVGLELVGNGGAFLSLKVLRFDNMHGWKKWSMNSGGAMFPCLQHLLIQKCHSLVEVTLEPLTSLNVLKINDCPNLVEVTLEPLTSLNVLKINACPNLVEVTLEALPSLIILEISRCDSGVLRRLVRIAPSVTRLDIRDISGLNDVVWRGLIEYLGAVEELTISSCNEMRYLWESEAVASKVLVNLKDLVVFGCDNLVSLGEKEDSCRSNLLTSLRMLDVSYCENMQRCGCPDSIERLVTAISIPRGGQKLKSLTINNCNKLLEREWGEQKMNNRSSMPMLEELYINDWPHKKLMVELNSLVYLTKLRMVNCERLESFPGNNLTSLMELQIRNCPSMDVCGAWPPNLRSLYIGKLMKPISEWGSQKFPSSLVGLHLHDEDGVKSCSQISHLLPSSLTSLYIYKFEKLESVSVGLQHLTSLQSLSFLNCHNLNNVSHLQCLTSLQYLRFEHCPNVMDLPQVLLPPLLSLVITNCPKLKERCSKTGGYVPLISDIPFIRM